MSQQLRTLVGQFNINDDGGGKAADVVVKTSAKRLVAHASRMILPGLEFAFIVPTYRARFLRRPRYAAA
jgi:hypothetical protein